MAKAASASQWQGALVILTGAVVATVVVAALYWAQVVFIPLALALYLAFLLNPAVRGLQRRGLGRVPSVIVVVLVAGLLLTGVGWLIVRETSSLVSDLPNYTSNLRNKIKSMRSLGSKDGRLEKMLDDLDREFKSDSTKVEPGSPPPSDVSPVMRPPSPVVVESNKPSWFERIPGFVGSLITIVGSFALSLVLVIFMLLKREDLRNRFIRLVGHARISFTTKAFDEAGQRVSQYLIVQAAINGVFGIILAIGLYLIGVKYALLWGFLAALLRYLPFVGIWIAAAFPTILSLAEFDSWWPPIAVIGLILALEIVVSSFIEPWLFGQSMGISEVGLLVTAAVASFLWGPVGLLLSAPLAACLVVLGRYVPQLAFFDILLGDQPALDASASYYQRLLARDHDEAVDLVLTGTTTASAETVYDQILVPALTYARRDSDRDELNDSDLEYIHQATSEILEDLGEQLRATNAPDPATPARDIEAIPILGCPARDELDELALEMLGQVLDPKRWRFNMVTEHLLAAELIDRVAAKKPAVICIASLPPGGLAHTRYLCKRLRASLPNVRILVGRWGLAKNIERNQDQLRESGANEIASTILETRSQLNALVPVLVSEPAASRDQEFQPAGPKVGLDAGELQTVTKG